jgi:glycine/D-amino acid oxidase-like deaminating enzyme
MTDCDTLIIGGGVAGASCAHHLTDAGVDEVVLIEEDQSASKASGRAAGFLTPDQFLSTGTHPDAHQYIIDFWRDIATETALTLHYGNTYTFARTADSAKNLERLHRESAVESKLLTGDEVRERIPDLSPNDISTAFMYENGMHTDPYTATTTVLQEAVDTGAVVNQERVTAIKTSESGYVKQVETDDDVYTADNVILAAGAWSKKLARTAGISMPLKPRISQIAMLQQQNSVDLPLINDPDLGLYYRSEVSGDVLIGGGTGTEELDPDSFSTSARESFLQEVAAKAPQISTKLTDSDVSSSWSGRCSATPDRHPLVGESPIDDLHFCCGFNGEGIMYAPVAGRIITDLLLDRKTPFDRSHYTPDRFDNADIDFEVKSAVDW